MKSRTATKNFYAEDLCHFLGLNPLKKYTFYFIFKSFQMGCLWTNDNCFLTEENTLFLKLHSSWIHKSQLKSILRCYIVYYDMNRLPTYGSPSFQYRNVMECQQPVYSHENVTTHIGYATDESRIIDFSGLEENQWYNQVLSNVNSPNIPQE